MRSGLVMLTLVSAGFLTGHAAGPVEIRLDPSQAFAVLAILDRVASSDPVDAGHWRAVFNSVPHTRLRAREAAMEREFSDEAFRTFATGRELVARRAELRRTLDAWADADLEGLAARVRGYLPAASVIRATVYPVIKPQSNSFVWELDRDPAIFFFLDAALSRPEFENAAAHELHHVGLASLGPQRERLFAALPEPARAAAWWMGAFGEGLAMLAAAGSIDTHPHAASPPEVRARWDRELANASADLRRLDEFFLQVVGGTLDAQAARSQAMSFFGEQGPWYTVGYRMAVAVERRYGRETLLRCMEDPRRLLATWNQVAAPGEGWSPELLAAVEARPAHVP